MNTEEKLNKIQARCQANLELAQQRTPGKWEDDGTGHIWTMWEKPDPVHGYEGEHITLGRFDKGDFDFIAACAGSAEAGWLVADLAIEGLKELRRSTTSGESTVALADAILAEMAAKWPDELL